MLLGLYEKLIFKEIFIISDYIIRLCSSYFAWESSLMLPFANKKGVWSPFINCLFTATSASCVTGLIVYDTATYWSIFGKVVLICLIQIGGLGIVTMSVALMRLSGRKISIKQRNVLGDSISVDSMGSIVKLTGFIIKSTAIIEGFGALMLFPSFLKNYSFVKAFFMAIFTSISAFCNAGFDLMGNFSSLASFTGRTYPLLVLSFLIITGGIGFLTWDDFKQKKMNFSSYRLQCKIALTTSIVLLIIPTLLYYIFEFGGSQYGQLNSNDRWMAAFFQAVTTRTAGFNLTDQSLLSPVATVLTIFLMLIGGCPGSTAGGMKTTTIAVLFLSMNAVFHRKQDENVFSRRLSSDAIRNASAILMIYLSLFLSFGCIISALENLPLRQCLYETASAVGTVGITMGITTSLGSISKILLIFLMFLGRIGGLTMIYAALPKGQSTGSRFPKEDISIG